MMDNPGIHNLGDADLAAINAATTAAVITLVSSSSGNQAYVGNLEGMLSATILVNFNYGSGGTTLKVMIDSSVDQGTTWIELSRLAFSTSSSQSYINLVGLTPKTTPVAAGNLSDNTSVDGIYGDRFRARILTTGTYAGNTSLSVRLCAR